MWPHVPKIQWEQVWWPITNTTLATFVFLIIVVVVSVRAKLALWKKKSKFKTALLHIIGLLDSYVIESFGDKKFARAFFPLIVGIFFIILFGNLFGLVIDWLGSSVSPTTLVYLRPMHSDLNTTLVLGIVTVVSFLGIAIKHSWGMRTAKGFFFNFKGETLVEKCINVFVGWLHLIGIPSTIASLSLRLFGNIFAGIVLIGVISFLGAQMTASLNLLETGRFLSLPFWFFELFVAFIQAAVFAGLMIAYFNQNREEH